RSKGGSPNGDFRLLVGTAQDEPRALLAAINGQINTAVTVVIARHRRVCAHAPLLVDDCAVVAAPDRPGAAVLVEDRQISLAVAVVIARHPPGILRASRVTSPLRAWFRSRC